MKTMGAVLGMGAAVALSLAVLPVRAGDPAASATAILERHARSPQFAPAVEEIVKLSRSGVPDSVTLAYIQTSATHYPLAASDIVRLREQGVSSQVVTAMLQHSDELRKAAEAKQTQTTATASSPPATAAAATTVTHVPAPSAPASTVSVTYIGYPRHDYYPRYYGYGVGYPAYYSYTPRYLGFGYVGPRVGFGVGYGGIYAGYHGGFGPCR